MSRGNLWAILALALFATVTASATVTSESIDLTACNPPICALGLAEPFATVTKSLDTSTNQITFTVLLKDNLDLTNDGFGFNSVVRDLTLVGTPTYTGTGTLSLLGAFNPPNNNYDGFGSFTYSLDTTANGSSDVNNNPTNTLTFVVTSASTTLTLADVDQPAQGGTHGIFAVDVSGCNATITANCTGFAGTGPVPEPTAIAFFGTGLVGLGFVLRRKFARR